MQTTPRYPKCIIDLSDGEINYKILNTMIRDCMIKTVALNDTILAYERNILFASRIYRIKLVH